MLLSRAVRCAVIAKLSHSAVWWLRRGNCCVQAALLLYGSSLVLHHGMPSQTLLAFMNGAMPQIAVEHGRKMIASSERPSIDVVENETIAGPKAVAAEPEPKAARA